jgi:hypothetical protein
MKSEQEHPGKTTDEPGSLLVLGILSLVAGAVTGLVGAVFRLSLEWADRLRDALITRAHGESVAGFLLVTVTCAAATGVAAWLVRRFCPHASGSGIPHVEAVLKEELQPAPFLLIPVKFLGGVLAIGSGLALGREGPSVQMGASLAHLVGKVFRRSWPDSRVLLAAGAGAGLATAFNAPIAGAVFVWRNWCGGSRPALPSRRSAPRQPPCRWHACSLATRQSSVLKRCRIRARKQERFSSFSGPSPGSWRSPTTRLCRGPSQRPTGSVSGQWSCAPHWSGAEQTYPQAPFVLALDSLYACGPVFALAAQMNWSVVATFKEGRTPGLWREYRALLQQCPENVLKRPGADGRMQEFRWVPQLDYQDSQVRRWKLSALECTETGGDPERQYFAWLTLLPVGRKTVAEIAQQGGRYRWKVENEGFNRQKNSGLNLEHVYSTDPEKWKAYYLLLPIAFILVQLLERGSLLRRLAEEAGRPLWKLFGSLKNVARRLLESLRYLLWEAEWFDARLAAKLRFRLDSS